jgi:hypothetical protein
MQTAFSFITLAKTMRRMIYILPSVLSMANPVAAISSNSPPNFTLIVPASFDTSVTVKHYRKGQLIFDSPPFRIVTLFPMTEYRGWSRPRHADCPWIVRVYATRNPKVTAAYAKARDGFQADLDEGREFLGLGNSSHVFARFERKHFRWGDAVSFLKTSYQETPDSGFYVPDNSHVTYEVWGVTQDQQYTVVASVCVSHPKLADWPKVRVVKDMEALKQDRDYQLIEECSPNQFQPSLSAFDRVLDSLEIRHASGGKPE